MPISLTIDLRTPNGGFFGTDDGGVPGGALVTLKYDRDVRDADGTVPAPAQGSVVVSGATDPVVSVPFANDDAAVSDDSQGFAIIIGARWRQGTQVVSWSKTVAIDSSYGSAVSLSDLADAQPVPPQQMTVSGVLAVANQAVSDAQAAETSAASSAQAAAASAALVGAPAGDAIDAHLGGNSTNLVAKQPTAVISRTDLATNVDATAIIQAALDALDATQGGTVTLPTVAFQVRVDGTLRLDPRKCLDIPPGVELARLSAYSSSTAPVVNLAGNHAALIGKGLVSSQNDSPNGVVMFGPPTVTLADFGASMTSGSPNLTVSGARDTFTAGDVGKSVSVAGAGASGGWCTGTITSVTDSTHAVLSANAATTISNTQAYWGQQLPVCWAKADVRVTGNSGATSEGFSLYSSPQGQTGLTVGCKIRGQVQNVKTGVGFHLQANGNVASELQWYRITGDAVLFDDAVEDNVTGGFVHSSPGLAYIIHGQRAVYCVTRGVQGEPGAGAAYTLDANSTKNSIDVNANAPGSSTDNGTNNHIQQGAYTRGQRIEARDGLTLPIKTGGYADGDFARTPTTGLLALDSSASPAYSRIQARVGSTWKSSALYTRLLQASTIKDPPSIAAGATWDTPITVTGALLGDRALAAPSGLLPAGIVWSAAVSAADTVTLRLANVTAAAIDPPSMTWYVEVAGK